jgi:hypothetical protein
MKAWQGCRMLTFYKNKKYDVDPCDVVLTDDEITVSYKEPKKGRLLSGKPNTRKETFIF